MVFMPTPLHMLPICQVALIIHLVDSHSSSISYLVRPCLIPWMELITLPFASAESRTYQTSVRC